MGVHTQISSPVMDIASQINAATERMIAIQIEGYPKGWTPEEYRETAIKHLFGAAAVGVMASGDGSAL